MNGIREYWLYELEKGKGIYQGCTGPGAEGVVRRVVESLKLEPRENPGEPFRVFCFEGLPANMPTPLETLQEDHAAVQDAGFLNVKELIAEYKELKARMDGLDK